MASIEPPRYRKDGTAVYWVRWRTGGRGSKKEGEPFTDLALAEKFKGDVNYYGDWPPNYLPGVGYVDEATMAKAKSLADGGEPEPDYEPVLFRDFAKAYIDRRSGIEARTKYDYHRDVRKHMDAKFGDKDVKDPLSITADDIADWVNWLADGVPDPDTEDGWIRKPVRPKTIHNHHGLLYAILQSAVDAETPLRATNPCSKTSLPRADDAGVDEDDEEMLFLTEEEFAVLYALADPAIQDLLYVFVGTGLRFSEITALQRRDLHLNGTTPYLRVLRAWKRQPDYTFLLGPPKSEAGRRNVPLNASMVTILRRLIDNKRETDYVFGNRNGTEWRHANFFNRYWQPLVYKAVRCEHHRAADHDRGLRMRKLTGEWIVPCHCPGTLEKTPRVHDLRHTCVAWLIAANVPLSAIAVRIGHEDSRTTERKYGHLLPELDTRQADAMEAALAGIPSRTPLRLVPQQSPEATAASYLIAHEHWDEAKGRYVHYSGNDFHVQSLRSPQEVADEYLANLVTLVLGRGEGARPRDGQYRVCVYAADSAAAKRTALATAVYRDGSEQPVPAVPTAVRSASAS